MQDYHLRIQFGGKDVNFGIGDLTELTIVQDINRFLPELRLRVEDKTGILTHILPFDKKMSKVMIEFALDSNSQKTNALTFDVYRKTPDGDQNTPANIYDIKGLLSVDGLFSPDYSRSFSGDITETLGQIGAELGVDQYDISPSLNYKKTILQPLWSNAQLLKHLKEKIVGFNDEYGYKSFIKCLYGRTIFTFKSISEMAKDPISFKFALMNTALEDQYPIMDYSIFDNYKLFTSFAAKTQAYDYFDYKNSIFKSSIENVQDYYSMTDFYMIDSSDSGESSHLSHLGRNNDFTEDFKGPVKSSYGNRLMGLSKIWITTWGVQNIVPGQTVQLFFPYGGDNGNIYSYQYSGYWLVETIVHNLGDHFLSRILLTRNGMDTNLPTTLLKAVGNKKS